MDEEITICTKPAAHAGFQPATDLDGAAVCAICYPQLRADAAPGLYWDYPAEGGAVSFDDSTATATPYDETGAAGEPRPYTAEEQARADQRQVEQSQHAATTELARAVGLNAAPDQLAALQEATLAAEGIAPGDPWRQPTGAHDAYPLGAVVRHNGLVWQSDVDANVWEPGVSQWTQIDDPEEVA